MMTRGREWLVVMAVAAAVAGVGCSREEGRAPSASAAPPETPMESARRQLGQALQTPAAPEVADQVAMALTTLVDAGQVDAAADWYLRAAAYDAQYARAAFSVVAAHHYTNAQWQALAAWARVLAGTNLPPDLRAQAFLWEARAFEQAGDLLPMAGRVGVVIETLEEPLARRVAQGMRELAVNAEDPAVAAAFADAVTAAAVSRPSWAPYAQTVTLMLAIRQGRWDDAEAALDHLAEAQEEGEAAQGLTRLMDALRAADAGARAEPLAERVALDARDPAGMREVAARYWLRFASDSGSPELLVMRLTALGGSGLPAPRLLPLFQQHVYEVLKHNNAAWTDSMLTLARNLETNLDEPDQQAAIRILRFDASFLQEDYGTVVEILDAGIPGRDEPWHAMARNKALAHKALADGDLAQAVTRFRQFMKDVEQDPPQGAVDPTTGLRHTLAMTLGFNERRLGDLLTRMGESEPAREAFAAARRHYESALAEATEGSREREYLQHELSTLPE